MSPAFADVPKLPADPIFGVKAAYFADEDTRKVNLGVGAFKGTNLQPWVLPVVRQASIDIATSENKEYSPIAGHAGFLSAAAELLLGADATELVEKRVASVQSCSGTGALRLAGELLRDFHPGANVMIPNPTWGNHRKIFDHARVPRSDYRYWDSENLCIDIEGMVDDIKSAPSGAVVLLHVCAHNPTGMDPTPEQWTMIADAMKSSGHLALFDCAYQGFASGDLVKDRAPIRLFANRGISYIAAQSFSKNMGLYNERCGAIHVSCETPEIAAAVRTQVMNYSRGMISNCPANGARIAHRILTTPALYAQWQEELTTMVDRLKAMRSAIHGALVALKTPGSWDHIQKQIGMFSFTGMSPAQVAEMKGAHIYMLGNGRICLCGLSPTNIDYVAKSIDSAVRAHPKADQQ